MNLVFGHKEYRRSGIEIGVQELKSCYMEAY